MIQNIRFHSVAQRNLVLEQLPIFPIRLCINVDLDKSILVDGYHIVKTKQAVSSAVQLQDVLSVFYVDMVWFWRLHRDEIFVSGKGKHNANVWAACPFVVWYFIITTVEKFNVVVADMINS